MDRSLAFSCTGSDPIDGSSRWTHGDAPRSGAVRDRARIAGEMRRALLLMLLFVGLAVLPASHQTPGVGAEAAAPAGSAESGSASTFSTVDPGEELPGGDECVSRVRRDGWEPRPENGAQNATTGTQLILPADSWTGYEAWHAMARRVDGDFTGTTDEIIQWASCKWGFDEDLTRAQAYIESGWVQATLGDAGHSVGLLQVKAARDGTPHRYTWPHSRTSTAFNVDYALAWRRACYEGHFAEVGWLPPESRGDLTGCLGLWYSGTWGTGHDEYLESIARALHERPWDGWE